MTEMTERLKPLGEMFGLPQDFNEDTKDKVTELKISHLKDYHKGNLGENRYSKQDLEDLVESVKINGIIQPLVVRPLNENDEYEMIKDERKEFITIKPRANNKTIRFTIPKVFMPYFEKALKLRKFVLNGKKFPYLFHPIREKMFNFAEFSTI